MTRGVSEPNYLVPKQFLDMQNLFGEHYFLVRQPALEVISYLNQIKDSEKSSPVPNTRFILWGETGCGKSSRYVEKAAAP